MAQCPGLAAEAAHSEAPTYTFNLKGISPAVYIFLQRKDMSDRSLESLKNMRVKPAFL